MAAFKTHIYRIDMGDDGTTNCDYRGKGEYGAGENDQHRTIPQLEVDPASDELIATVLEYGPGMNRMWQAVTRLQPAWLEELASFFGLEGQGPIGIRHGLWDQ